MKKRTLFIDLQALQSINHTCTGCREIEACCCAKFDICITEKEMEAIVGIMPAIAQYCPWLCEEGGYRNAFEETDDGLAGSDIPLADRGTIKDMVAG